MKTRLVCALFLCPLVIPFTVDSASCQTTEAFADDIAALKDNAANQRHRLTIWDRGTSKAMRPPSQFALEKLEGVNPCFKKLKKGPRQPGHRSQNLRSRRAPARELGLDRRQRRIHLEQTRQCRCVYRRHPARVEISPKIKKYKGQKA